MDVEKKECVEANGNWTVVEIVQEWLQGLAQAANDGCTVVMAMNVMTMTAVYVFAEDRQDVSPSILVGHAHPLSQTIFT